MNDLTHFVVGHGDGKVRPVGANIHTGFTYGRAFQATHIFLIGRGGFCQDAPFFQGFIVVHVHFNGIIIRNTFETQDMIHRFTGIGNGPYHGICPELGISGDKDIIPDIRVSLLTSTRPRAVRPRPFFSNHGPSIFAPTGCDNRCGRDFHGPIRGFRPTAATFVRGAQLHFPTGQGRHCRPPVIGARRNAPHPF